MKTHLLRNSKYFDHIATVSLLFSQSQLSTGSQNIAAKFKNYLDCLNTSYYMIIWLCKFVCSWYKIPAKNPGTQSGYFTRLANPGRRMVILAPTKFWSQSFTTDALSSKLFASDFTKKLLAENFFAKFSIFLDIFDALKCTFKSFYIISTISNYSKKFENTFCVRF